ncbi:MAG: PTS glucose transporter subunit IIBC [Methylotenera sp.]|nr:PTS glucose transporter subunit IIBC [Oligoflexia bacterium]
MSKQSIFKQFFGLLQKIGKSLMLPVSVLPVAGILLGVGSSHFGWMPTTLSDLMAQSGGAIFGSLPLIFAIATAVGLAGNDGVAALAATVGFVVLVATLGVMATVFGVEPKLVMGMKSIDTGVFGGILIGAVAAALFKRYYRIQLPSYLGFFAGKRFVPIVTALAAIVLGVIMSLIWPPFQRGIDTFSHFAAYTNPTMAAGIYGLVERLLIPFGLHHIWNVPFFFEIGSYTDAAGKVVHGDITRFFAGDKTAGILGGAYLFKMWGLPAAGLAMWHCARPENKARIGSLMVSAALTSFLTGITEPLEFSFLFVAPLLYAVHSVLAASGQIIFGVLGAKLGFTFSQGFIDYILYYSLDTKPWLVLLIGPFFGLLYYSVFRFMITKFNLKTPGREIDATSELTAETAESAASSMTAQEKRAVALVQALGGRSNLVSVDACITRLRIELRDVTQANESQLKALGATGVLLMGHNLQAIFGPLSENLKTDIELALQKNLPGLDQAFAVKSAVSAAVTGNPSSVTVAPLPGGLTRTVSTGAFQQTALVWLKALGGEENVVTLEACAATRLRITLKNPALLNEAVLRQNGVQEIMKFKDKSVLHLIVGSEASTYALAFQGKVQPAVAGV